MTEYLAMSSSVSKHNTIPIVGLSPSLRFNSSSNPFVPMGTKVVMNSVEYLKAKQELTRKIEIFQETHEQILEVTAKERDLMKEIQRVKQEEEAVL